MLFILLIAGGLCFGNPNGISFSGADMRDVAKALSIANNVNIIVDQDIDLKVTIFLQTMALNDILDVLTKTYDLVWSKEGDIYHIKKSINDTKLIMEIYNDSVMIISAKNVNLGVFIDEVNKRSTGSLLAEKGLKGRVNGTIKNSSLKDGLKTLFEANGYVIDKKGNAMVVGPGQGMDEEGKPAKTAGSKTGKFNLDIEDGKIAMSLSGADLGEVLNEIAYQAGMNIITYGKISGTVEAKLSNITVREAISRILAGTNFTYTIDQGILLVGERNASTPSGQALSISKLIHLNHIKAEGILELLPQSIPKGNIQIIKEQNGILVMGTQETIKQVENFLTEIDIPTPQIAIEAIIVEFKTGNDLKHGLHYGRTNLKTDKTGTVVPGLDLIATGSDLKSSFKSSVIGRLPDKFNITLEAIEEENLGRVLARPKIATLNGYKASINVGTTSYYNLKSGIINNGVVELSRLQEISSGIKLDITPWISKSGEITAEISPEVSNSGAVNPVNPPDISKRSMSTTVRLNDGETIVIGGLIKSDEREHIEQVPLLGRIPLLGWLFKYRTKNSEKSELLVYITPHIISNKDYVNISRELQQWDGKGKPKPMPADSLDTP